MKPRRLFPSIHQQRDTRINTLTKKETKMMRGNLGCNGRLRKLGIKCHASCRKGKKIKGEKVQSEGGRKASNKRVGEREEKGPVQMESVGSRCDSVSIKKRREKRNL